MSKVTIQCKNCGKEFQDYESNHRKFCCRDCKNKYQERQADDHKIKNCQGCGKAFRPKENRIYFCSLECYYNYIRVNSYTRVPRQCKWCGKEFYPNYHKKQYCSKKCAYEWYSEFKRTDEQIKEQTEKIIRTISGGKMKRAFTKPHLIIDNTLDDMGIEHVDEYNIKYYAIDVYLPESELMIEVMGDYWHTNPVTKYKNPNSSAQKKTIHRDKRKHTYVRNQYGIEILYLWESDIENSIDLCKELIMLYINNGGILQDYNSYNYKFNQGTIALKDDIIQPLFIDMA